MLDPKMEAAINGQINAEIYSSYLYMSMATWFDSQSLPGMAHWMRVQAQEEWTHAIKFYTYVNERGGRVILSAIDGPATEWDSPLAVFQAVAEHEAKVTGLIHGLMDLALEIRDHASSSFLQWFVNEQVEEEASAAEAVGQMKLAKDNPSALLMLDKDLATRVFTMPVWLVI
ncbi:MAG: ferritin [Desulfarculus sp.]|nr:ferritin [Pseudomonadota bacterium]MBV1714439.1 ferritin [Desulfarculus sp.]MBU4574130.1 ferritin [Pseudomonadota bacterium]MBU4597993.1 ferritin [Pseudomonadota bacterium]MBV1738295.1 ferritin [Desulfarculus sp.]